MQPSLCLCLIPAGDFTPHRSQRRKSNWYSSSRSGAVGRLDRKSTWHGSQGWGGLGGSNIWCAVSHHHPQTFRLARQSSARWLRCWSGERALALKWSLLSLACDGTIRICTLRPDSALLRRRFISQICSRWPLTACWFDSPPIVMPCWSDLLLVGLLFPVNSLLNWLLHYLSIN